MNMGEIVKSKVHQALSEYEHPYIKGKMEKPVVQIDVDVVRGFVNRAYELACVEYVEQEARTRRTG